MVSNRTRSVEDEAQVLVCVSEQLASCFPAHTRTTPWGVPHCAVQQRAAVFLICVIDNDPDLYDTAIPPTILENLLSTIEYETDEIT